MGRPKDEGTSCRRCPDGRQAGAQAPRSSRGRAVTTAKWKVLSLGWRRPGAAPARSAFLCGYFKPWKPPPRLWPRSGHEIPAPKFPLLLSARHRRAVVSLHALPWGCSPVPPSPRRPPGAGGQRDPRLLPLQPCSCPGSAWGWLLGPSPRGTGCPRRVQLPGCHQPPPPRRRAADARSAHRPHLRWGRGRASALRLHGRPGHAGDVLGTCWGCAGDAYSLSLPHPGVRDAAARANPLELGGTGQGMSLKFI